MAYTIDFTSPIQVTVNGSSVTSPYTLKNGDKISATIAANSSGVWQGIKVTTSGTFSQSYRGETVNLDFSKVNIFLRGYDSYSTVATVVNISYTEAPPIQIDMTKLSKWSTITSGTHNVTLIAKADGYADSLPSTPVSFTRIFKTLKGLYKFIDVPEVVNASGGSYLNFVSNGKSFKQMSYGYIADMYQLQYANDTESITAVTYNSETSVPWTSANYKFVDLGSTAQEVSDDFYTWFTTNTNVAYTVSTRLTNLTASAITPMIVGDTQTITLTASTNYNVPAQSAITVAGATITNYTKTSGTVCKITIGSVTGNITITASGVEQTTTISGKWKFKDDGEGVVKDNFSQAINFTSNGQNFAKLETIFMGAPVESQMLYGSTIVYGEDYGGTWTNEAYKTVDFGTTAQTVGKIFYNWFTANAVQIVEYNVYMHDIDKTYATISPSPLPKITADDTLEITVTITDASRYVLNDQANIYISGATLTNYTKVSDTSCKLTIGSATSSVYIDRVLLSRLPAPQNVQIANTELTWNSVASTTGFGSGYNAIYDVYIDGALYEEIDGAEGYSITVNNNKGGYDTVEIYASDTNPVVTESYNLVRALAGNFKTSRQYVRFTTGSTTNFISTSGGVTKISGTIDDFTFKVTGDGTITVRTEE